MKLLLCLLFILGCWSFAVPLQNPMGAQEQVEKLSWTESNCIPAITSAENETICIQAAPFDPVFDSAILPIVIVTQYCGYVQINRGPLATKMFFWLVMSETDPKTSPLVLWMNGGPGVSSLLGLWDQWGPQILQRSSPNSTVFNENPNRLTEKMSWIFLDQPSGVGYSPSQMTAIEDSMAAALDISAFLDGIIRIATFNYQGTPISLQGVPLHIGGESYAGHYLPAIGSSLVKNKKAKALNLKSIFCGNGIFDATLLGPGINDLLCSPTPPISFFPVAPSASASLSSSLASRCTLVQKPQISLCSNAIAACTKGTSPECDKVLGACDSAWGWNWGKSFGANPYDAAKPVSTWEKQRDYYQTTLAYFLNVGERKDRFTVDRSVTWGWHNSDMNDRFRSSGDWYRSYIPQIGQILDGGIDFMLYVGDADLVAPVTSVKATALKVVWNQPETMPGFALKQDRFKACAGRPDATYSTIARPGGSAYAQYIRAGHLNYVRVLGAGHMINENKPAEAKHLFETWVLSGGTFAEC